MTSFTSAKHPRTPFSSFNGVHKFCSDPPAGAWSSGHVTAESGRRGKAGKARCCCKARQPASSSLPDAECSHWGRRCAVEWMTALWGVPSAQLLYAHRLTLFTANRQWLKWFQSLLLHYSSQGNIALFIPLLLEALFPSIFFFCMCRFLFLWEIRSTNKYRCFYYEWTICQNIKWFKSRQLSAVAFLFSLSW